MSQSKILQLVLCLSSLLLWMLVSCVSDKETQLYSADEANLKIAAAFLAKDTECNMLHQITVPVVSKVTKASVTSCVAQILAQSCTAWAANDPTPSLCLALDLNFR